MGEFAEGLFAAADLNQDNREVVAGSGEFRLNAEGVAEEFLGLIEPPAETAQVAEVVSQVGSVVEGGDAVAKASAARSNCPAAICTAPSRL